MRVSEYIKDHIITYVLSLVSLVIIEIFLNAYKVKAQAMGVVAVVFILFLVIEQFLDYNRKKVFFNKLDVSLRDLDKKYLLPEVLEEPDFLEGRIICGALRDCGKSMAENVADNRRQMKNFREYIELWVHEIKIPVAALNLMCHNNENVDSKMKTQLKRIDDYIDNVLYYARSENAEKDYIIKKTPLNKAFSAAAGRNREELQLIDAVIDAKDLNIEVMTDGKWLEFMIGQLMDNTIKYRDEERQLVISVRAEREDQKIRFIYEDNGSGIDNADLPRIFEKSFTGNNGRNTSKSTGMGLYIVKNMCERLGHTITAESERGKYTRFIVTFAENDHVKI